MTGGEKTRMDPETRRTRQRQLLLFSGLAGAALIVFAVWISAGGGKGPAPPGGIEAELVGDETAEASWVRRSEARIGELEARLRETETRGRRIEDENARLRARLVRDAEDGRAVIDRHAATIDALTRRLEAPADPPVEEFRSGVRDFGGGGVERSASSRASAGTAGGGAPAGPMIQEFEGVADPSAGGSAAATGPRPLESWLPAGSYADAVVLAGVDASAGVSSQGDPRPVLLRLTSAARSAAEDGEALEADVAGCTLTGAAYGDLSSEKVYVRLRTLTCAGPEARTVIETEVAGFVAGSGKAGVRGPVVSREGALIEKAFLAGLVSGAGETAANVLQTPAGGAGEDRTASLADVGRAGLGAGAGSAGRRVADYLIRRAEQYQPVIQLQTGTRVTVVFIKGARIDGRADGRSGNNNRKADS